MRQMLLLLLLLRLKDLGSLRPCQQVYSCGCTVVSSLAASLLAVRAELAHEGKRVVIQERQERVSTRPRPVVRRVPQSSLDPVGDVGLQQVRVSVACDALGCILFRNSNQQNRSRKTIPCSCWNNHEGKPSRAKVLLARSAGTGGGHSLDSCQRGCRWGGAGLATCAR